MKIVLQQVQSQSDPSQFHEIRLGKDNVVYCTCPSWRFSRSVPRDCKHLRAFRAQQLAAQPAVNRSRMRRIA